MNEWRVALQNGTLTSPESRASLHRVVRQLDFARAGAAVNKDNGRAAPIDFNHFAEQQQRPDMAAVVMQRDQVAKAYARWAPIYDVVFGPVFRQGRRASVIAAERVGGRILEVGVGTGLSLSDYSRSSQIVGIDISEPMLEKARERVRQERLDHVKSIAVMDAEDLTYPTGSFDVVVAQYVVTAVPNPERALDEFVRVTRPGGEIILTTRIGAETGFRGAMEKMLMPVTSRLGWRTEFPFARYERWVEGSPRVALIEKRALPPLGHFWLLRFAKLAESDSAQPGHPVPRG